MNPKAVGKTYPPQTTRVTAEAVVRYARAYGEDNPRFVDESRPGGVVAPPLFGVVVAWPAIVGAVADPDVGADLLRLVHREQDMIFSRTIRPQEEIASRARVLAVEEVVGGETLIVEVSCHGVGGEEVQRMVFTAFVRGGGRRERSAERPLRVARGEPLVRVKRRVDEDQTYRYAEASGDHNPIHTDEVVARLAGFPGVIVQGLCTMAMASKVVLDELCGGEAERLTRLRARFARPVFPGQELTTAVWEEGRQGQCLAFAYEVHDPSGLAAIKDGLAEIRAPEDA